MGGLAPESTQSHSKLQLSNNSLKDKKKKRRSRGSTQSFSLSGDLSSYPSNCMVLTGNRTAKSSNVGFTSLPMMHTEEQAMQKTGNSQSDQIFSPNISGRAFSNSCPEPVVYEDFDSYTNGHFHLPAAASSSDYRKYYSTHWSAEAVERALEGGDVFKALFRVNAHNRVEAYCKIDGVQTDVLVSGLVAQNRAVEGDIVAVKVDPPSLWTKMKGFIAGSNDNSVPANNCTLKSLTDEDIIDCFKGKKRVSAQNESSICSNDLLPQDNGFPSSSGYFSKEIGHAEPVGPLESGHVSSKLGSLESVCSGKTEKAVNYVKKLSAIVNSIPSKRPTGRVVAIIENSPCRDTVVGFLNPNRWIYNKDSYKKDLKKNKHPLHALHYEYIVLTPTDPRLSKMMVPVKSLPDFINKRLETGDATIEKDLVGARVVDWKEENSLPQAEVLHIFGRGGEVQPQIAAILFANAIDDSEFSPEVLACLPSSSWEVPRKELESRRDIRNLCVFTVDPAAATDLDDALSVEMLTSGVFRVGVHIADVSYFVLPDTALDNDAQIRTTSVYLLQRKFPMLPSLLSENLGSLNPGVERLAFSMFWDINLEGKILDRWIGRTVIQSCCKLSYEHVQGIIDGEFETQSSGDMEPTLPQLHGHFEWADVIRAIKRLNEISKILKEKRFTGGALSLETPKVVFLFDEDGIPYDAVLCGCNNSNVLVEEFMLLANTTAAEVITRAYPSSALLRRQPEPNIRKLREFETFCSKHGLKLDTSSSGQLHRSLEGIRCELKEDSLLFDILVSYALRPMQLAAYFCSGDMKVENGWNHYALAVPLYTHFTSPLRRYPDIIVHRILSAVVEAEQIYLKYKGSSKHVDRDELTSSKCFTGLGFDRTDMESFEAQQSLSAAASKYSVPRTDMLVNIAGHCNERKLASRHVKDATEKLYIWALLKKKQILFSEARVLGLGPRFMSVYIQKLAVERRIYYDEVEGLTVEWLDTTSTLVLSTSTDKHFKRGSYGKCRAFEEFALMVSPFDVKVDSEMREENCGSQVKDDFLKSSIMDIEPAVFPLTVRLLSTISVALHAVGGDDGPLDIGTRLYISSYFC